MLLSFFQAQAERRKLSESAPSIIYAIEEPESAQHPNHQSLLIESLVSLSEEDNVQVLFTTHSSNLVRELPFEALVHIRNNEDQTRAIDYCLDVETRERKESAIEGIIETLGILPNPTETVKLLIYVEGPHDVNALLRYSKLLAEEDSSLPNLNDCESVAFVLSGGSCLKYYVDYKYLDGLGKAEFHLYDNDVPNYEDYVKQVNERGNPKHIAYNTQKPELESYLTADAIMEAYTANGYEVTIPEINDTTDVPELVAKCLKEKAVPGSWDTLTDDKKKDKESRCKKLLNTQAVDNMTIDRLTERGGLDELKGWLRKIDELLS